MHLDLHIHTTCSDGLLAPEAVAAQAHRAGLHAIAITDHDTVAGVARAAAAAEPLGLMVIAGTELSCSRGARDMHLLGYGVDPEHPALAEITGRLGLLRRERIGTIVARLVKLGVTIRVEDVRAPEGNASIGRPHVAEAMVRLGVVRHTQEAFSRYLADGGPAYIPSRGPAVQDAIAAIHAAGGISVWAHPSLDETARFAELAELGLDGVEVLRPGLAPTSSSALEHAARDAGLVVSGGSDWHGGTPPLGSWYVTHRHVGALLERLGVTIDMT
ncbi:MAG TPA: PHP domain-containing protein [Gemmatimonadales bacterium]